MQYFDDEVQEFFKEYAHNISFNISIDGNKQLHDSCRIQPNGEGSYDIDIAALNHYNKNYTSERNSKMTLAPSNIMYLYDSVVDFIKNDMKCINMNCVFEEGWNKDTAATEYYQLKKLAQYLIYNNLEHIYISIFNEKQEDKESKYNDSNFCGGTGSMLALRPNGQFYPCIRYMPTSVGNDVKDLCIGNIDDGLVGREQDSEVLKLLDSITRRSQTNDICFNCPIGNDCASCSALGHTIFGTPNKKATFTCIQMIAEALANVYYWNNLYLKYDSSNLSPRINNVPDDWALLVIDDNELYELKLLECAALSKYVDN
jgi:radical SAM peptide maturase (CXXX-repeat target family)